MKIKILATLAATAGCSFGATIVESYTTATLNSNPSRFSSDQTPRVFTGGNAITGRLPLFSSANPAIFRLPKFDTSLGTLTSVTLRATDQLSADAQVENLDSVPTQATRVEASGAVFLGVDSNEDGLYQRSTEVPSNQSSIGTGRSGPVQLAANDNSAQPFMGPDSAEFLNVLSLNSVSNQSVPASQFSLFEGSGLPGDEIAVFVRATSRVNATGIGNNNFDVTRTSVTSNIEVIYTFEAVPEPSSTLALGGLLGLGLFVRRRR